MPDRDLMLLETVHVHRERLVAAFLSGPLEERRTTVDPVHRLARGLVLAALACGGCIAYALVASLLASGRWGLS